MVGIKNIYQLWKGLSKVPSYHENLFTFFLIVIGCSSTVYNLLKPSNIYLGNIILAFDMGIT